MTPEQERALAAMRSAESAAEAKRKTALVDAAPRLLAALQTMVAVIDMPPDDWEAFEQALEAAEAEARAAIQQATGGTK